MERALTLALDSIIRADGTLTWQPLGDTTQNSLTVRYEIPVNYPPTDNYKTRGFHFGLIAADPDF